MNTNLKLVFTALILFLPLSACVYIPRQEHRSYLSYGYPNYYLYYYVPPLIYQSTISYGANYYRPYYGTRRSAYGRHYEPLIYDHTTNRKWIEKGLYDKTKRRYYERTR